MQLLRPEATQTIDFIVKLLALGAPLGVLIGGVHEYAYILVLFGKFVAIYDIADVIRVAIEYTAILFSVPIIAMLIEFMSKKLQIGVLNTASHDFQYRLYVWVTYSGLILWSILFLAN